MSRFGSCWLKCWTPPEQWNQSSSGPCSGKILVGVWTLVLPRLTQIPSTCSSIANSTLVLPRPVFLVTPPKNSWTLKTIPKTVTLKRISASCGQPLCATVCPYFFCKEVILNLIVWEPVKKGIPNVCPELFARLLCLVVVAPDCSQILYFFWGGNTCHDRGPQNSHEILN